MSDLLNRLRLYRKVWGDLPSIPPHLKEAPGFTTGRVLLDAGEAADKIEEQDKIIRQLRTTLQNLETANNRLAATRPPEVYDAMIKAGQEDDLFNLDRARLAARDFLSKTDPTRHEPTAPSENVPRRGDDTPSDLDS